MGIRMATISDPLARIIWVDCEMTGLDVNTKTIVEVACVVTEADLTVVEDGLNVVISHPENVLQSMDSWCKKTFAANGLLKEIQASEISLEQAEQEKYMPTFASHLHYRTIDVSSIKELAKRWYPDIYAKRPRKAEAHRALDDICESIEELQWYRKNIFVPHT
ncbi:unnamed protein product [Gongylonema pulchrum]|uniref:Exonuclease domain-containing protein n=2 Tax=Gongylonema pulchrum TaxID=637853 RepID=A0A3P7PK89_9BILA|nr:unnamed protein product [Gongylonema pulchrum]